MLKFIRRFAIVLAVVAVIAIATLVVGSLIALDWSRGHGNASLDLPRVADATGDGIVRIDVGDHEFRARLAGHGNTGTPVLLLHGFPETSAMWTPLLDALADSGHRAVAFDQRGYSPMARPDDVEDYAIPHLVGDVLAVADALGWEEFHLVGHDWGSVVGWTTVMRSQRLVSFTSLSIPHVAAFGEALANDPEQQRRSRYFMLFRTPWLPEMLFAFNDFSLLREMYAPMTETQKSEYIAVLSEPGAMTAALNWYRAMNASQAGPTFSARIDVPTLFIWGRNDAAVSRAAVDGQRKFFDGPFEEFELDAGHWLMEEVPELVIPRVVRHISRVDGGPVTEAPRIDPQLTIGAPADSDDQETADDTP